MTNWSKPWVAVDVAEAKAHLSELVGKAESSEETTSFARGFPCQLAEGADPGISGPGLLTVYLDTSFVPSLVIEEDSSDAVEVFVLKLKPGELATSLWTRVELNFNRSTGHQYNLPGFGRLCRNLPSGLHPELFR